MTKDPARGTEHPGKDESVSEDDLPPFQLDFGISWNGNDSSLGHDGRGTGRQQLLRDLTEHFDDVL